MSSKQFKNSLTGVFVASALVCGMAFAATPGQISGSKHDLTSAGTGANKVTTAGAEICVFCHTPHGASTTIAVPLWNRANTATVFSPYSSPTMDYTMAVGNIGAKSLICLSCHDGSTSMDTVLNAPGSGTNLTAGKIGYAWTTAGGIIAAGSATSLANLGADLTNDHPIGIPYCGGGTAAAVFAAAPLPTTTAAMNCRDLDFNSIYKDANNNYWADTSGVGTATVRDKTDMQLYATAIAAFNGVPSVECASCHDAHNGNTVGETSFLRTSNTGSRACLACHKK